MIAHLLQTYGYFGLFGALALEYLFVPVPGETTLTTAGILGAEPKYHLSLGWLILSTALGTWTGALIAYFIGRTLGRPFVLRFGRFIRLTPARVDRAEKLFAKYTLPTLLISRYIAVIRILVPYIAGINKINIGLYAITMLIGSFMWTSTFVIGGRYIERAWHNVMQNWHRDLIPAILIVIVLGVGYWFLHRFIEKKINGEALEENLPNENKKE